MDRSSEITRISRRRFVGRNLGALTGALAAPYVVPAAALGKHVTVAPSERITMGFIGLGHQGRGHLLGGAWTYLTGGYVARKDVQVLATCDVRRERREQACDRVNRFYSRTRGKGQYRSCEAYNDF